MTGVHVPKSFAGIQFGGYDDGASASSGVGYNDPTVNLRNEQNGNSVLSALSASGSTSTNPFDQPAVSVDIFGGGALLPDASLGMSQNRQQQVHASDVVYQSFQRNFGVCTAPNVTGVVRGAIGNTPTMPASSTGVFGSAGPGGCVGPSSHKFQLQIQNLSRGNMVLPCKVNLFQGPGAGSYGGIVDPSSRRSSPCSNGPPLGGTGCGTAYGTGATLTGPLANQAIYQAQKGLFNSHNQRRRMDSLAHQVRQQLESAYREAGNQIAAVPQPSTA